MLVLSNWCFLLVLFWCFLSSGFVKFVVCALLLLFLVPLFALVVSIFLFPHAFFAQNSFQVVPFLCRQLEDED